MARTVRRSPDPEQQRRSRRRLILGIILGVVVLIVVAGLSFYLRLTGGPALPRAVRQRIHDSRQQTAPAPQAQTPAAPAPAPGQPSSPDLSSTVIPAGTPSFDQQIQQARQAALYGDTAPRTMYITDAELTAQLGEAIRKHPEVKQVNGYFESGKTYLAVRVDAKGRELNFTVVLRPTVIDGCVRFDVDQVFVGKVAAPPALAQKVQEEISKRSTWFTPEKTGIHVERIELKSGIAVLHGRPIRR